MLEQLVNWLAYGSLLVGATAAYLHLNKLWSRKHIQEVADSISISGTLLEAVPILIFGFYFLNLKAEMPHRNHGPEDGSVERRRTAEATETSILAAASRRESPLSIARTTRRRRSLERGAVIGAGLLVQHQI